MVAALTAEHLVEGAAMAMAVCRRFLDGKETDTQLGFRAAEAVL